MEEMSWHFVLCLNEEHLHSKNFMLIRLKIVFPNRVADTMVSRAFGTAAVHGVAGSWQSRVAAPPGARGCGCLCSYRQLCFQDRPLMATVTGAW